MLTNLNIVLTFLEKCESKILIKRKRGKPQNFSNASMIIFFVQMMLKKIYTFQGMSKYATTHYVSYGWVKPPARKTIRRRFLSLPAVLQVFMPQIAKECDVLNHKIFGFSWAFIDKSIFRAMGGIWHKVHMKLGVIPHSSIDADASWGYSPYHRWRFGYGLHLIVNQHRFPIMAAVTTAKTKDYNLVETLIKPLLDKIGVLVGDAGYFAVRTLKKIYVLGVFLYTRKIFEKPKTAFKTIYNDLLETSQAQWLYKYRKPSIEPTFSLIKELFDLNKDKQLPYRGLAKVSSFLMIAVLTIQLLMFLNFTLGKPLASTMMLRNHF